MVVVTVPSWDGIKFLGIIGAVGVSDVGQADITSIAISTIGYAPFLKSISIMVLSLIYRYLSNLI